jgi:hypothetical protein
MTNPPPKKHIITVGDGICAVPFFTEQAKITPARFRNHTCEVQKSHLRGIKIILREVRKTTVSNNKYNYNNSTIINHLSYEEMLTEMWKSELFY